MSQAAAAPKLESTSPRPVDVAAIERELIGLWGTSQSDEQESVTRACMSNLIIFCATQSEARAITQGMDAIVRLHPSRVLLLVADADPGGAELEAYVSAQCYVAGGGRQVCSEHVTVNAASDAARRLPSIARPLLIGDLPTSLWWVSEHAPPTHGDLFTELASMSDHLIYDSIDWTEPARGVVAAASWVLSADTNQIAADLAWRRLEPWRRLVSQSLDPRIVPGALESVRTVVVEHGPHALPTAWLLIGWMASRLGWQPVHGKVTPGTEVTWSFTSAGGPVAVTVRRLGEGESDVRSVSVGWSAKGRTETLRFATLGRGRLGVMSGATSEPARIVAVPDLARANLVARQLPDLGRDLLFLDALKMSNTMAESLL
jgi:glucose-6-phosphate dehydrogenase assembly protein OpcA